MLVAADAGPRLARLEVHERPHPLHFHEVLVQRLEEQVAAGGDLEAGRAIRLDGHDAVQHGDPDVGVPGHGQVSAESIGAAVFAAVPVHFGRPRLGDLLHHAQVLDRSRRNTVQSAIDVADEHGRRRGALGGFWRCATAKHRRRRARLQQHRLPAGDLGVVIDRHTIAEDIQQVNAVAGPVVVAPVGIAGDQEELVARAGYGSAYSGP